VYCCFTLDARLLARSQYPAIVSSVLYVCGELAFRDVVVVFGTWASKTEAEAIEPWWQHTEGAKVQFGL